MTLSKKMFLITVFSGFLAFAVSGAMFLFITNFDVTQSMGQKIFEIIFFPSLVIILCALIIWLAFQKIVVNPISRITKVSRAIAEGEADEIIAVASNDEIGELGRAFNDMTAKLKETKFSLEKKVAERTEILNQKVSELYQAQKALTNLAQDLEEERWRQKKIADKDDALLASIGEGMVAVDSNCSLLTINHAAEKMLGWKGKEIIGRPFLEVVPMLDSDLKPFLSKDRPLALAITTKKKYSSMVVRPYYFVRKDKTNFPVAVTVTPLFFNGEVIGAINIFRDITKDQIIDRAKNEFVSVASHQLRTPLTGIKWFAELLGKGKLSKKQREYLEQMEKSNQRMIDLVNDLLNVSRIDLGRNFNLEFKKANMAEIAATEINEESLLASKNNVKLKLTDNFPKELLLSVDAVKIRQVFHNLVNNAIKYSVSGGEVIVGAEQKSGSAVFSVADSGIGIPEHQQNQVFTKFFRGENAMPVQTEGTGLGLYIVKAIVESHGGKVWFTSDEMKGKTSAKHGTTFYFSIPNK